MWISNSFNNEGNIKYQLQYKNINVNNKDTNNKILSNIF